MRKAAGHLVPPRPCRPPVQCPAWCCLRSVPCALTLVLSVIMAMTAHCVPLPADQVEGDVLIARDVQTERWRTSCCEHSSYHLLSVLGGSWGGGGSTLAGVWRLHGKEEDLSAVAARRLECFHGSCRSLPQKTIGMPSRFMSFPATVFLLYGRRGRADLRLLEDLGKAIFVSVHFCHSHRGCCVLHWYCACTVMGAAQLVVLPQGLVRHT